MWIPLRTEDSSHILNTWTCRSLCAHCPQQREAFPSRQRAALAHRDKCLEDSLITHPFGNPSVVRSPTSSLTMHVWLGLQLGMISFLEHSHEVAVSPHNHRAAVAPGNTSCPGAQYCHTRGPWRGRTIGDFSH